MHPETKTKQRNKRREKDNTETAKAAKPLDGIRARFVNMQAELTPVTKDRDNPFLKSNYATLKAIVDMLRPLLAKYGIGYVQSVGTDERGDKWMVTEIFCTETNEILTSRVPFACAGTKPQEVGSAITYTKRYGLQCAFGVVVADDETDDDGNAANGNKAHNFAKVKPSATPAKPDAPAW